MYKQTKTYSRECKTNTYTKFITTQDQGPYPSDVPIDISEKMFACQNYII